MPNVLRIAITAIRNSDTIQSLAYHRIGGRDNSCITSCSLTSSGSTSSVGVVILQRQLTKYPVANLASVTANVPVASSVWIPTDKQDELVVELSGGSSGDKVEIRLTGYELD